MAAARDTTGETDIRRKLDEYVDAHLTRHMYDTDESGRCAKPSDCPNKPNWSSTTTKSAPKTKPSATGRGNTTAKPARKPKSSPADSSNKKARSSTP